MLIISVVTDHSSNGYFRQLLVVSCPLSVVRCQLSVVSCPLSVVILASSLFPFPFSLFPKYDIILYLEVDMC